MKENWVRVSKKMRRKLLRKSLKLKGKD